MILVAIHHLWPLITPVFDCNNLDPRFELHQFQYHQLQVLQFNRLLSGTLLFLFPILLLLYLQHQPLHHLNLFPEDVLRLYLVTLIADASVTSLENDSTSHLASQSTDVANTHQAIETPAPILQSTTRTQQTSLPASTSPPLNSYGCKTLPGLIDQLHQFLDHTDPNHPKLLQPKLLQGRLLRSRSFLELYKLTFFLFR